MADAISEMNAASQHSKVSVKLKLSDKSYLAGDYVTGKLQLECRADKGLGIGTIMVELLGTEELTSRDHSATSTFMQSRRLFQGPGLPPSNAVLPHPIPGTPSLPQHHWQGRKGQTEFFFRFPLPFTSPSSIDFSSNLARVRYQVRASVSVAWKGEKRIVMDRKDTLVEEALPSEVLPPENTVVAEGGKVWVHGKLTTPILVAGQHGCIELRMKNQSSKKTTGITVAIHRTLQLPNHSSGTDLLLTETTATFSFQSSDYCLGPGAEGVATLAFLVPIKNVQSVSGGLRYAGEDENCRSTESLFTIACSLEVKIGIGGFGSKNLVMPLPVTILQPNAVPEAVQEAMFAPPSLDPMLSPPQPFYAADYGSPNGSNPSSPISGLPQQAYPAPQQPHYTGYFNNAARSPHAYSPDSQLDRYFSPILPNQPYYYPPPSAPLIQSARPTSAEPRLTQPLPPAPQTVPVAPPRGVPAVEERAERGREEGKGERASRIAQTLHASSRNRSVSPVSHRFTIKAFPERLEDANAPEAAPKPSSSSVNRSRAAPPPPLALDTLPPAMSSPEVLSPRPMPSPRLTAHEDESLELTHGILGTLSNNQRVQTLERIAARQVQAQEQQRLDDARAITEEQEPDMSTLLEEQCRMESDKTSPVLPKNSILKPPQLPRASSLFVVDDPNVHQTSNPPTLRSPAAGITFVGGLEALEKRLAADVGTRKSARQIPTGVRSIIGKTDSNLTVKPEPSSAAGEIVRPGQRKLPPTNDTPNGRVVAWLGPVNKPGINSDEGVSTESAVPGPEKTRQEFRAPVQDKVEAAVKVPLQSDNEPAIQNSPARGSSGFRAFKKLNRSNERPDTEGEVDYHAITTAVQPQLVPDLKNVSRKFAAQVAVRPREVVAKYDVRSARGGRGGQVTSVAAVWTAIANDVSSATAGKIFVPSSRQSTAVSPTARTSKAGRTEARQHLLKSTSSPAVVSSPVAIPVLSSTASLARPVVNPQEPRITKALTSLYSIPENPQPIPSSPKVLAPIPLASPAAGYAFGQAKLRELIMKYQGK